MFQNIKVWFKCSYQFDSRGYTNHELLVNFQSTEILVLLLGVLIIMSVQKGYSSSRRKETCNWGRKKNEWPESAWKPLDGFHALKQPFISVSNSASIWTLNRSFIKLICNETVDYSLLFIYWSAQFLRLPTHQVTLGSQQMVINHR